MVVLSPTGILIALGIGTLLFLILRWMLALPPPVPQAAAVVRAAVGAIQRILVPTHGEPYSERAVELACRLGLDQHSHIVLAYVVEVPRTLPMGAPLPRDDAAADEALNRARTIVELRGLEATTLIKRARVAGEEIVRVAKDEGVDMIILGRATPTAGARDVVGRTVEIVLRRAPCEVVVDQAVATI